LLYAWPCVFLKPKTEDEVPQPTTEEVLEAMSKEHRGAMPEEMTEEMEAAASRLHWAPHLTHRYPPKDLKDTPKG
jgi:hypothetical protein